MALDPLALLQRERYPSRAGIARATGLPYQALRTWTDGLWTADRMPPVRVLAALSGAVSPPDLQRAVREAMLARADQADGPPPLTCGRRVVLEALRGFDDDLLVAAAPHVLLASAVRAEALARHPLVLAGAACFVVGGFAVGDAVASSSGAPSLPPLQQRPL